MSITGDEFRAILDRGAKQRINADIVETIRDKAEAYVGDVATLQDYIAELVEACNEYDGAEDSEARGEARDAIDQLIADVQSAMTELE